MTTPIGTSGTLKQLSSLLDIIINQETEGNSNEKQSYNALVTSVLPYFKNRKLDEGVDINNLEELTGYNENPSESTIAAKIFLAFKSLFLRNNSLFLEDKRYLKIFELAFPFFNSLQYSSTLSDHISVSLIDLSVSFFKKGGLARRKLIKVQRDYMFDYMDVLLSDIIKSFTNANSSDLLLLEDADSILDNLNIISVNEVKDSNLNKISKISIIVRIIKFLMNPSIYDLYLTQYHSSFVFDSFISKAWFCLDNIIINIKFVAKNEKIISLLDSVYSSLLLSTINYYYNDPLLQGNRLQLAVSHCHRLLNWYLLPNFGTLQLVLAESLLKLGLNLNTTSHIDYLWQNIGAEADSLSYFTSLVSKVTNPDLKMVLQLFLRNAQPENHSDHIETLNFQTSGLGKLADRFLQSQHYKIYRCDKFIEDFDLEQALVYNEQLPEFIAQESSEGLPLTNMMKNLKIMHNLGLYSCYLSKFHDLDLKNCKLCDSMNDISSYISQNVDIGRAEIESNAQLLKVFTLIEDFIFDHIEHLNVHLLISTLITLGRIFRAFQPPMLSADRKLFDFLKGCFTYPIREIRLLTVKLFPLFIHIENDQGHSNFDEILSYLQTFNILNVSSLYVFEGYILTLGELLMVKTIDSRYYILLKQLIKFMSDSDEFRSNLAITQLRIVAKSKNLSPWQVVEPYIPLISIDVIKDRKEKPGLISNFCLSIEMSIPLFLERTLKFSIPFLITCYNDDHISFISEQINKLKSKIIQTHNEKILAYLLITQKNISNEKILNILSIYDASYKSSNFMDFLLTCEEPYLIYNLIHYYEPIENNLALIKQSIEKLAILFEYDNDANIALQKMLNRWLLIVIQMITTTLDDKIGSNPFYVKIRSIRSIICLLKLCDTFETYIGQIMLALQLALKYSELRKELLLCLKAIIIRSKPKDLRYIFHSLMSQFLQIYNSFGNSNQQIIVEIIKLLKAKLPDLSVSYKLSLEKLPGMEQMTYEIIKHKSIAFQFGNRFKNDNRWVVEQVLDDLILYIEHYDNKYRQLVTDDEDVLNAYLSIVEILTNSLFKTNKLNFNYESVNDEHNDEDNAYNPTLAYKAAKLLGLLGNLDIKSNLVFGSENDYDNINNFLLVTDLNPKKDSDQYLSLVTFSKYFLKDILVKSFISSINPEEQKHLSFAMQEYLILFKFPTGVWDSLDDLTKNILEPLKSSRYKGVLKFNHESFPIYRNVKDYTKWLKEITACALESSIRLFVKTGGDNQQIMAICATIPLLGFNVSRFVLPYAILYLVIMEPDTGKNKKELQAEFKEILEYGNSPNNEVLKESHKKCITVIIEIFQFLKAWSTKVKEEEEYAKHSSKASSKTKRSIIQRVDKFLNAFDTHLLAKRCADCDMYEASILFLEKGYKEKNIETSMFASELKDMYVELENYDQLHGALKTFSNNSLNDKLLQFKYNDDPQISNESLNAIAQYNFDDDETMEDVGGDGKRTLKTFNKSSVTELLEVLNKNCEYEQLLLNLKNYKLKTETEHKLEKNVLDPEWVLYGLQASIYTGDLTDLERWTRLSQDSNSIFVPGTDLSIYYEISQALICLSKNKDKCLEHINSSITYIGLAILNAENLVKKNLSDYMVLLHSLSDFKTLLPVNNLNDEIVAKDLKNRLQLSKKDFKSIWKIHSLKSSIYRLHSKEFQKSYKDSLIESCQILRENGKLPQATKMITKALVLSGNDSNVSEASKTLINVEFSKLFWAQNDYETALKNMGLVINNMSTNNPYYLEFSLTYLNWLDRSAEGSSDQIVKKYRELLTDTKFSQSSEIYYQCAVYQNKLLEAQPFEEADGSLDDKVVRSYLNACINSKEYVHEILPKAITLWLDYYSKYFSGPSDLETDRRLLDKRQEQFKKLNLAIKKCIPELGPKWYIVLSQIISRITHDDKDVIGIISTIIIELTIKYPWILIYSVFSLARSIDDKRRAIGKHILSKLQSGKLISSSGNKQEVSNISKIVASGLMLLESIYSVCNNSIKFKHTRSSGQVKDLYDDLHFNYPKNSECLALGLPIKTNIDLLYNLRDKVDKKVVYYHRFHERVKILFSLQQPRRVRVTGSDGNSYFLLFKPRDDLRKDNKVMEFSTVMNGLLDKNFETKTRNMEIKSFAATPLNETTGIIEWVQNFITLRPIIESQLRRNNINMNMRSIRTEFGDAKEEDKLPIFKSFLEKYPPVLSDWIIETCPNISKWYKFRSQFTRSLAVMSIVGYLIGIGDRHLDNIMLSKETGMIMHIDFDCIFEKGKILSVPEIVPFRLTPNLIDAMGALGYEGSFRKSCELTMSIIRDNENILMNFLESFIHDPLMDWRSSSDKKGSNKDRIRMNQERVYKILRRKIRGILSKDDDNTGYRDSGGLSVSVSLQVEQLIHTAVNHDTLSKMYVGWMPFL